MPNQAPSHPQPTSQEAWRIEGLSFAYSDKRVLEGIDLSFGAGEFVCLLGPSGCGKTSLLRLLAGLETPLEGRIFWKGSRVTGPSLERGVVFQDYSLFPWLSLRDNILLALAKARPELDKKWRRHTADEFLERVGLSDAAAKYPFELSGGMQQRGAIVRALAIGSPALLLDEPFGALDPSNRARLQDFLLSVWSGAAQKKSVIFVTHDVDEALYLADRIVMLGANPGRVLAEHRLSAERPRSRRGFLASAAVQELRQEIERQFLEDSFRGLEQAELIAGGAEGI